MLLPDIIAKWKLDSAIDATDLTKECQRIYSLHSDYVDLWVQERLKLKSLELEEKRLKLEKHEWYTQGPSKETRDKGWSFPSSGKILKPDVPIYFDADKELQTMATRLELQKTKVDTLKMIIDAINQRTYVLNGMIKYDMFRGGS